MNKRVTQHEFTIDPILSENYFSLLCKYYEGVKVSAVIEDTNGNKHVVKGKINKKWFSDLPITDKPYYILTDFFPVDYASIRTLPPVDSFLFAQKKLTQSEKKIRKIRNVISEVITARIVNEEKYLYRKFPFTRQTSFDELLRALHCLKEIDAITRCYVDYKYQKIILVLNDVFPIGITNTFISDAVLPSFDIEEGFAFGVLSSQWTTKEWKRCFRNWKVQLETDYSSWNEPIFPPDYIWSLLIR